MNLKLESFIKKVNKLLQIKIIKIQTSMLDNNTYLINDTIYDKRSIRQLRNLENLSLWKYVEEELVQSYFPTLPNTTIYDFILNSTMYRSDIEFTLKKATKIMGDRIFKYAILLMVYAYEALRIDYCKTLYWDDVMNYLNKLSDALLTLNGGEKLHKQIHKINEEIKDCYIMLVFQRLVNEYANIFLTPREIEKCYIKNNYRWNNIKDEHILSQNVLDKILKEFSKPHRDIEPYKFKLICEKEIERKFQQIFMLIDAEFKRIHIIEFDLSMTVHF
ncbi:uncharacterized protein LOC126906979 [Daktulosphaira vitifoliae]|uniref:uncharacterized protein LOC126906979 n=1 Tax=Daktulosphaira vitifoliae TaxID=58002 RepID=UPI0021A9CC5E|nr:uncharacterized protein LOC126906979 [Daktulosphaira vitifoliae]